MTDSLSYCYWINPSYGFKLCIGFPGMIIFPIIIICWNPDRVVNVDEIQCNRLESKEIYKKSI